MENKNPFDLSGKKALITGGGGGLGFAVSRAFVNQGAQVIISGRDEAKLQKACNELGSACSYKVFDLENISGIPSFATSVTDIDILVNNAGINMKKEALSVTDEEFERIIKVNQQAVFAITREVAKNMTEKGKGNIVMISSMAAHYGLPKVIAYTASKTAIEGMTRALAVEWAIHGIRVNCIAPGFIATDMSSKALSGDKDRMQRVMARTPAGRLGHPDDIGNAAAYLASDAAAFVTGAVLVVDGGNSIGF